MNNNPLSQYYRTPALSILLPSKGRFWPEDSIELSVSGEVQVYPMTAKDEILLKTPDSLLNGEATATVIQSCIPAIKNAFAMPSMDLDSILIAIRIASYGENLEFSSTCSECKNTNDFEIDLRTVMDSFNSIDWDIPVEYKGLKIYLKSTSYKQLNNENIENFERQKIVSLANNENISEEEKLARFSEIFLKLTDFTINSLSSSIDRITLPDDQTVDNSTYIKEFIDNADRNLFELLKSRIAEIKNNFSIKPLEIQCTECSNTYQSSLNLDQSNFFG